MSEPGVGVTGGPPTDDGMIEKLADEAERGFEPGQLQGRRRGPGRPPLGEARRGDDPELAPMHTPSGPRAPPAKCGQISTSEDEHAAAMESSTGRAKRNIPGRGFFPPRQGSNRNGERSVHRQVFAQRPGNGKFAAMRTEGKDTNRIGSHAAGTYRPRNPARR